jgi:uncharacterized protein (DUF58 family)
MNGRHRSTGRARIRPTATFAAALFVLGAIWYAAASQNNAPAYLLLFTLGSVMVLSFWHGAGNLNGLDVSVEAIKPVFAGQEIAVPLEIINRAHRARFGIAANLRDARAAEVRADFITGGQAERLTLRLPVVERGEFALPALHLTSLFPFGFFRVSRRLLDANQSYVVYPQPAGAADLPPSRFRSTLKPTAVMAGPADEFAGTRAYIPGESQRHIDWKAVARGQPFMTKQFASDFSGSLVFDFNEVPSTGVEARLSQIARWIVEAERAARPYGLRLPGCNIAPAIGPGHFHNCLRQLALYR